MSIDLNDNMADPIEQGATFDTEGYVCSESAGPPDRRVRLVTGRDACEANTRLLVLGVIVEPGHDRPN